MNICSRWTFLTTQRRIIKWPCVPQGSPQNSNFWEKLCFLTTQQTFSARYGRIRTFTSNKTYNKKNFYWYINTRHCLRFSVSQRLFSEQLCSILWFCLYKIDVGGCGHILVLQHWWTNCWKSSLWQIYSIQASFVYHC